MQTILSTAAEAVLRTHFARHQTAQQPGTVYSVIPAVKDKKPVFGVLVLTTDGNSVPVTL